MTPEERERLEKGHCSTVCDCAECRADWVWVKDLALREAKRADEAIKTCGCRYDGPVQVVACSDHNAAARNLNRAQAMLTKAELERDAAIGELEELKKLKAPHGSIEQAAQLSRDLANELLHRETLEKRVETLTKERDEWRRRAELDEQQAEQAVSDAGKALIELEQVRKERDEARADYARCDEANVAHIRLQIELQTQTAAMRAAMEAYTNEESTARAYKMARAALKSDAGAAVWEVVRAADKYMRITGATHRRSHDAEDLIIALARLREMGMTP